MREDIDVARPGAVELGLLERTAADPQDDDSRLVYSDFVAERGDPRGELICLALTARGESHRAQALLIQHGQTWPQPWLYELPFIGESSTAVDQWAAGYHGRAK